MASVSSGGARRLAQARDGAPPSAAGAPRSSRGPPGTWGSLHRAPGPTRRTLCPAQDTSLGLAPLGAGPSTSVMEGVLATSTDLQ